uniref:PH domain-containing protein n=1 Tax=Sinocyclocheilus anshuiensis TaxID=1608454 RepID=A0A671MZA8_9TELE
MLISFNYVSAEATAKFYNEPVMEELYTGYLLKSPPQTKSWKRRFFVLSKTGEDYQLTYHANDEKRDKPLGEIDISKISLLFTSPEAHQKWDWIQKQFKCSPSFVLFLKVDDDTPKQAREYFLIGENRDEVDGWLNALVKVMTTQKSQNKLRHTDDTQHLRYLLPLPTFENNKKHKRKYGNYAVTKKTILFDQRVLTSQETKNSVFFHMHMTKYTNKTQTSIWQIPVIEEKDEKDGKQDEPPVDSSEYMTMGSVVVMINVAFVFFLLCSETHTYGEKEICVSQNELKNSLILTQEEGKPCVSRCRQIQDSRGDQILATDTVQDIQKCLKRLSKDEYTPKTKSRLCKEHNSTPLKQHLF